MSAARCCRVRRARAFLGAVVVGLAVVLPVSALAALVQGKVTTPDGAAVVATHLAFLNAATQQLAASSDTDGSGHYAVDVPPGTYDVDLAPPPASGFLPQTLEDVIIGGDTTLNVVLVAAQPVTFSGTLVDRDGAPLVGQTVALRKSNVDIATDVTDAAGAFSLVVTAGTYQVNVRNGTFAGTGVPQSYTLFGPMVSLTQDRVYPITLQTRVFSGSVVGPLATPVPGARISAQFTTVSFGDFSGQVSSVSTVADLNGQFRMVLFPGTYEMRVAASVASGAAFIVRSVAVVDDVSLVIPFDVVSFDGTIVDRDGDPVSSVQVGVNALVNNLRLASAITDSQGEFTLAVGPGQYGISLQTSGARPGLPDRFFASRSLSLATNTSRLITLPNRRLTGTVTAANGAPVAGATVNATDFPTFFDGFNGSSDDAAVTNAQGDFALDLLRGNGYLIVSPAPASGFLVSANLTDDLTLPITVPPLATFSGLAMGANGAPVAEQNVRLRSTQHFSGIISDTTDTQGQFALQVGAGDYRVEISNGSQAQCCGNPQCCTSLGCCGATPPDVPTVYFIQSPPLILTQDLARPLELPARRLTGRVLDPDGQPLAAVELRFPFPYFAVTFDDFGGYAYGFPITDATGTFSTWLFPGSGNVLVDPPAVSGLGSFLLSNVKIEDTDVSLGVLLQFNVESVSGTVDDDGTVTTDTENDGATPSDPIETNVTTPNAGTITIRESPVTVPAPIGFRFLTQQIDITAPPATPTAPLVIVFTLDASRIPPSPPNPPANRIDIFRNGVRVDNCSSSSGRASPDPCVLRSPVTGDLRLTVLTSAASAWNFGIPTPKSLDAFACYKAALAGGAAFSPARGLLATDAIESRRYDLVKPTTLCNPAALDGAEIADADIRLAAYAVKDGKVCADDARACVSDADCAPGVKCGKQKKPLGRNGLTVRDAVGELVVDLKKPTAFLAPSAWDLAAAPLPPDPDLHAVERFTCYASALRTKRCIGQPAQACATDAACGAAGPCFLALAKGRTLSLADDPQQPPRLFEIKKPTRHCLPAGVDGSVVADQTALQCYAVKPVKRSCANTATTNRGQRCKQEEDCGGQKKVTSFCQPQATPSPVSVHLGNAIGALHLATKSAAEVCLPAR